MRFRNAFRLTMDNFVNVYKLLLFRLITGVLFFSLTYVVINLGLHDIFSSAEVERIFTLAAEFFRSFVTDRTAFLESFQEEFTSAIGDFLALLGANIGSIVGSLIGVCVIYLVARFVNGTATFALGGSIHDKMKFYSRTGFVSAYFKNIGKSVKYQLIYVPLGFVYDVLSLIFCWFFFFFTPSLLPSWGVLTFLVGLSLAVAAYICLQAVKLTFISAWIPSVVAGDCSVTGGFVNSLKRFRGFGGRFSSFLMTIYLVVVLNVVCAVCTLGSLLLISVPASYLLILCVQFVYYFEDNGKKYFLSFRKISGADGKPESMGD